MEFFHLIKASQKSGKKDAVIWFTAKSVARANLQLDVALEEAGIEETGRGKDYAKPIRTDFPVYDDLPEEGAVDYTWCERYELQNDDRHAPSPLPARADWLKKILNGPNGQLERAMDDILVTSDLTSRYKISRKTLWSWQSADTMPRGFVCPFPPPDWPGNPNRWRSESIKEWEDKKKIN